MDNMMKQFSLEAKTALITGASYGIGFAIAYAYAQTCYCSLACHIPLLCIR